MIAWQIQITLGIHFNKVYELIVLPLKIEFLFTLSIENEKNNNNFSAYKIYTFLSNLFSCQAIRW